MCFETLGLLSVSVLETDLLLDLGLEMGWVFGLELVWDLLFGREKD